MAKPATKTASKPNVPATRPKGGAATEQMPDYMRGKAGQGTEGVTSSDVALPLIKLAQAISPELQTIDGLKSGDFFHTVTEEIIGPEFEFTMVYCDIRAILWRPRDSGGGILARSDDLRVWSPSNAVFDVVLDKIKKPVKWATGDSVAASGLLEFGSSNPDDPTSQPAGTRMYNLVVMLPGFPILSPSILTCQRSLIKPAKIFLGKLKMSRAPAWGQRFVCQSTDEQGQSGPYKGLRFLADGFVEDRETGTLYEEFYERFRAEGVKIREADLEQASHEATQTSGGAAEPPKDRPKY